MAKPEKLFPTLDAFAAELPSPLVEHLRRVIDAQSPAAEFACYCHMLEWLASHLACLANSVYLARPKDNVDEKLEAALRRLRPPLPFGAQLQGLRSLHAMCGEALVYLPELPQVLESKALPSECNRLVVVFDIIKKARQQFDVPCNRLESYVEAHLPANLAAKRYTFEEMLDHLLPFRNSGVGHQADVTAWFPHDRVIYKLLNRYLATVVDKLFSWPPLRALLTNYEIVRIEVDKGCFDVIKRHYPIVRENRLKGIAPLSQSSMALLPGHPTSGLFIARRTHAPDHLEALLPYVTFPVTLQNSDLLERRYAKAYLSIYLEHGLITVAQRQNDLKALVHKLSLAEPDHRSIERAIQEAIRRCTGDETRAPEDVRKLFAETIGKDAEPLLAELPARLAQLSRRRRDFILEQIANNPIMSEDQLKSETELEPPDLDAVLRELEQQGHIARVNRGSTQSPVYKAYDAQYLASFKAILEQFQAHTNGFPRPPFMYQLADFCKTLMLGEGLVPERELEPYGDLFKQAADVGPVSLADQHQDGDDALVLEVGAQRIEAESIRTLYEGLWRYVQQQGVDTTGVVPFLMGRTRYLLNNKPKHANGTKFAVKIKVGTVYFEGNVTRAQGLAESLRLLRSLGVAASSPQVDEVPEKLAVDDSGDVEAIEEAPRLGIDVPGKHGETVRIEGVSVRRFLDALLAHLVAVEAPLADVVPFHTGKIRYLLADEPYHANGRPFDGYIERGGFYMNVAYTYEQALAHAEALCERIGALSGKGEPSTRPEGDGTAGSSHIVAHEMGA